MYAVEKIIIIIILNAWIKLREMFQNIMGESRVFPHFY